MNENLNFDQIKHDLLDLIYIFTTLITCSNFLSTDLKHSVCDAYTYILLHNYHCTFLVKQWFQDMQQKQTCHMMTIKYFCKYLMNKLRHMSNKELQCSGYGIQRRKHKSNYLWIEFFSKKSLIWSNLNKTPLSKILNAKYRQKGLYKTDVGSLTWRFLG